MGFVSSHAPARQGDVGATVSKARMSEGLCQLRHTRVSRADFMAWLARARGASGREDINSGASNIWTKRNPNFPGSEPCRRSGCEYRDGGASHRMARLQRHPRPPSPRAERPTHSESLRTARVGSQPSDQPPNPRRACARQRPLRRAPTSEGLAIRPYCCRRAPPSCDQAPCLPALCTYRNTRAHNWSSQREGRATTRPERVALNLDATN